MEITANQGSQNKRIQISRIRRSSSFVMKRPHYHSYYEIYYLLSGRCKMFIGQDLYYLKPGDAIIIHPLEIHRALYDEGQQAERYDMYVSKEAVGAFCSACPREQSDRIFSGPRISIPPALRPRAESLFVQMQDEDKYGDAYSHIEQSCLLYQILVLLGRCQVEELRKDSLNSAEEAIIKAAQYMNIQYQEPLTLNAMAAMANMSPTYFSRKFKSATGFCFKEYLNYIRVQRASDLLRGTDGPVTAIAMACGFSDGNYFGDVFRRLTGLSPRQYRTQSRKEQGFGQNSGEQPDTQNRNL